MTLPAVVLPKQAGLQAVYSSQALVCGYASHVVALSVKLPSWCISKLFVHQERRPLPSTVRSLRELVVPLASNHPTAEASRHVRAASAHGLV